MIRYIAYVAHKVIIYETLTITRLSNSTSYASYPHRRDESEEPTHELGTFSAEKIGAKLLAFEAVLTVTVTLHHPSTYFYGLFDMLHLRRGCIMTIGDPESDDGSVARVETPKREWSDRNASVYGENKANAAAASV
ncbi:hypothetical protein PC112_g17026 [Phytophthora cactorum]|nr:hypothetical protein PC112_g17026 [Phytophthora cactorum]KAG2990501.1 hypothetical protein PC120_g22925 [Phytophthora cactorum]KAG3145022.1 hypothetical protein C6341_g18551 [Phytophthora cactorum]